MLLCFSVSAGAGRVNKLSDKVKCQKAYSLYCQETSCNSPKCHIMGWLNGWSSVCVLHSRPSMWHWWTLSVPSGPLPPQSLQPHRSPLACGTSFPWHASWRQMCPPALLCVWGPLQILTGLSYCLLTEPKATGYLHVRGGAGSASVGNPSGVWASVRCVWRLGEGKESSSESSPVYLPVNRWRAEERGVGGKVETEKEKMIKRSCSFLSGYNANPPSFLYSLST